MDVYGSPPPCTPLHQFSPDYGVVIASNGVRHIRQTCPDCGWIGTHTYGYGFFTEEERHALPVLRDNRNGQHCERCDSIAGVELHHWAPYYLFGFDCDNWPTSYLCRSCHREWHRLVTPDMHRKIPT